jgi:hypothetical protein
MDDGPSGNLESGSLLGCLGMLSLFILGALIGGFIGGAIAAGIAGDRPDAFFPSVGQLGVGLGAVVGAISFPLLGSSIADRRKRRRSLTPVGHESPPPSTPEK